MALTPLSPVDPITDDTELQSISADEAQPIPSRTYSLDLETGEIGGIIDDDDAIRQFIRKAIATPRFRFLIYSDEYGCELEELIGDDVTPAFIDAEVPRMIKEALIYDDRIQDVTTFDILRTGDQLYVSFTVVLNDGTTVSEEVTI